MGSRCLSASYKLAGWPRPNAQRAFPKATLSRRLSALEETLNVRLVRRTKKGVVLTEQGQQLFDRSQTAFMLAEEAVAEVQDERVALSGTVRLSLPPDMATAVLAPALIRFKTRYPGVIIEMTLADRRVSLIEEGYDLVVRMGPVADFELMFRKIADLPRDVGRQPGLPLRTFRSKGAAGPEGRFLHLRSDAIWSNGI